MSGRSIKCSRLQKSDSTYPFCSNDCKCEEQETKDQPDVSKNVNHERSKHVGNFGFQTPTKVTLSHNDHVSMLFKQPPRAIFSSEPTEVELHKKIVSLLQSNGVATLTTTCFGLGGLFANSETEHDANREKTLGKGEKFKNHNFEDEYLEKRLHNLEVWNYYLKLQCLKLEKQLGLARSSYTKDL